MLTRQITIDLKGSNQIQAKQEYNIQVKINDYTMVGTTLYA